MVADVNIFFTSCSGHISDTPIEKQNESTATDTTVGTAEMERWIFILRLTCWKLDEQRKEDRDFCVRVREGGGGGGGGGGGKKLWKKL